MAYIYSSQIKIRIYICTNASFFTLHGNSKIPRWGSKCPKGWYTCFNANGSAFDITKENNQAGTLIATHFSNKHTQLFLRQVMFIFFNWVEKWERLVQSLEHTRQALWCMWILTGRQRKIENLFKRSASKSHVLRTPSKFIFFMWYRRIGSFRPGAATYR